VPRTRASCSIFVSGGTVPDGSAPGPGQYSRTRAQENEWPALLVSRQTLLDAGIHLDRRLVLPAETKVPLSRERACVCGACVACERQTRTQQARDAAADARQELEQAVWIERAIYGRAYDWLKRRDEKGKLVDAPLARPPRESVRGQKIVCSDPAPPGRRKRVREPEQSGPYPLLSDYTTKAALFDLFDFRRIWGGPARDISFAGTAIGRRDGFRRVDPTWERRRLLFLLAAHASSLSMLDRDVDPVATPP